MNRDEVLKVAEDCGIGVGCVEFYADNFERFAAAMYAKGAEDMRERAKVTCKTEFTRLESQGDCEYAIGADVCYDATLCETADKRGLCYTGYSVNYVARAALAEVAAIRAKQ